MKGFLEQRSAACRRRLLGEGDGQPQGHEDHRMERGRASRYGQFRGNSMRDGRYGGVKMGGQSSGRDRTWTRPTSPTRNKRLKLNVRSPVHFIQRPDMHDGRDVQAGQDQGTKEPEQFRNGSETAQW